MQDIIDSPDVPLLVMAAIAISCLGGWSTFHSVRVVTCWTQVPAQLVRYWIVRSEGKPDGQRFFRVVFRFTTCGGRLITTISTFGTWRKRWPVGTVVPVRYNPNNPRLIEAASFADMWGIPLTCLALLLMVFFVFTQIRP